MKWYQSPRFLCFAGGVAAALVGAQGAKSPQTRQPWGNGTPRGVQVQAGARAAPQNMKEDAQDLCAEAKQKAAREGEA